MQWSEANVPFEIVSDTLVSPFKWMLLSSTVLSLDCVVHTLCCPVQGSLSTDILLFLEDQPSKQAKRVHECEGRAQEKFSRLPTPHPLAFAVINLPPFLFSFARSTIIWEKRRSVNRLCTRQFWFFQVILFIMLYKVTITSKSGWNSKVWPFKGNEHTVVISL